jgi:surfeit locus 1 family protein
LANFSEKRVPSQIDLSSSQRRRFRPKLWAFVLTVIFAAITVRLGNWQGERAQYKVDQQTQLDKALAATPLQLADVLSRANTGTELRYRSLSITGAFVADELFYVDNRIVDGKAGYGLLQGFRADSDAEVDRTILVDRGWLPASGDRSVLPAVETPSGKVTIVGRINLPPSRNPGTFDNDGGKRLNYVNITEIAHRLKRGVEPFILEQTSGPGFSSIERPLPGANFEKNRGYQLQWYGFAGLSIIIFLILSFRKVDVA